MREHFNSYQRTLKRFWEVEKVDARPKNCLVKLWNANVLYWKTPNVNRE
jgi:hypothetical protein